MISITERLKEYGMYIRKSRGGYNLGWTFGQRDHVIHTFPSKKEAENAAEEIIGQFWEFHGDDFQQFVEGFRFK